jgi:hypothetical protein
MGDDASDEYMFTAIYSYIADTAAHCVEKAGASGAQQAVGSGSGQMERWSPHPRMVFSWAPCVSVQGARPLSPSRALKESPEGAIKSVFTCSVGRKRTHASFFVPNSEDVCNLLGSLAHSES